MRPAVNIGLSVSRVGSSAQTRAVKKMTRTLGLELAQYRELLDFSQFGTELDKEAQHRLSTGQRAMEVLKQGQYTTYSFVQEALMLFILQEGFLQDVPLTIINAFVTQFVSYVESVYPQLYGTILETADVTDVVKNELVEVAKEFKILFVAPETF